MKLENKNDKVIFTYEANEYELKSHPYEPCLYICKNDEIIKILHNAFDAYDLVDRFNACEKLLAADSKEFDRESFCIVLAAALNDKHYEMDWTFAAKLAGY